MDESELGRPLTPWGQKLLLASFFLGLSLIGLVLILSRRHHRSSWPQDGDSLSPRPGTSWAATTVVGMGGRDLALVNLVTGAVNRLSATPELESWPEVSPDGGKLVYAASASGSKATHLFVREFQGELNLGPPRQVTFDSQVLDIAPRFHANGTELVFARAERYIPHQVGLGGDQWTDFHLAGLDLSETTHPEVTRLTEESFFSVTALDLNRRTGQVVFSAASSQPAGPSWDLWRRAPDPQIPLQRLTGADGCFWPRWHGAELLYVVNRGKAGSTLYQLDPGPIRRTDPAVQTPGRELFPGPAGPRGSVYHPVADAAGTVYFLGWLELPEGVQGGIWRLGPGMTRPVLVVEERKLQP